MVVLSRPYWLSSYSHDPMRVAWMVVAAYVSSCGKNNPVTRIKWRENFPRRREFYRISSVSYVPRLFHRRCASGTKTNSPTFC
jgi:hypothetical protein